MTENENEAKNNDDKYNDSKKEEEIDQKVKSQIEKKNLKIISNVEFLKRIKRITKDFKNETIKLKLFFS